MNTWTCSVACNDNKATARSIQFDGNDVIIITAPFRLSKKLHSLPSSLGRIIQSRSPSLRGPMAKPPRDTRTLPSRQRAYIRLYARVDRLEDAISHFYNANDELRRRVSTLEKKLKRPLGPTPIAKPMNRLGLMSAKLTKDEMIKWFNSAPGSSRHERMLWAAHKIARLTGATESGAYQMLQSVVIEAERLQRLNPQDFNDRG